MAEDKMHEEVTLSDGRKATIIKGKGRHANEAMKVSKGSSSDYINALMAQLVEIDGHKIVMEDLEELDLSDYLAIQTKFSEINF